jgi:cysteine desulfuration protein SufE
VLGLVSLTAEFFTSAAPTEILANNTDPIELLHLSRTLSPTRRHGLAAVRSAIRAFAQQSL